MVEDQVIAEHLTALLTPTIKSQSRHFRELGLRERILTLPFSFSPDFVVTRSRILSLSVLATINRARNSFYYSR
jgi:hypothetical protein